MVESRSLALVKSLKNEIKMKNNPQRKLHLLLFLLSSYCISILFFRIWFTVSNTYMFLVWNLILAYIPFVISSIIKTRRLKSLPFFMVFVVWLSFLPNASYIITDIFHLKQQKIIPLWFDLLLVVSFAVNGMLLFFLSINDMHILLLTRVSRRVTWLVTILIFFLSGFGIYLGRFLRWNSWDVISNPRLLLFDIIERIRDPLSHPRTWGVTIGFGFLFLLGYLLLNVIQFNYQEKSILKR